MAVANVTTNSHDHGRTFIIFTFSGGDAADSTEMGDKGGGENTSLAGQGRIWGSDFVEVY